MDGEVKKSEVERCAEEVAKELESAYHNTVAKYPNLDMGEIHRANALAFYDFIHRVS